MTNKSTWSGFDKELPNSKVKDQPRAPIPSRTWVHSQDTNNEHVYKNKLNVVVYIGIAPITQLTHMRK